MSTSEKATDPADSEEANNFYYDINCSNRYARYWWRKFVQMEAERDAAERYAAEKKLAEIEKKPAAEKTLDEVYSQRTQYFLLAMALARKVGWRASWREKTDEWVVLVIETPVGEVSIHAKTSEVPEVEYEWPRAPAWDKSDAAVHVKRIAEVNKMLRPAALEASSVRFGNGYFPSKEAWDAQVESVARQREAYHANMRELINATPFAPNVCTHHRPSPGMSLDEFTRGAHPTQDRDSGCCCHHQKKQCF
jgi:hypothetical protein